MDSTSPWIPMLRKRGQGTLAWAWSRQNTPHLRVLSRVICWCESVVHRFFVITIDIDYCSSKLAVAPYKTNGTLLSDPCKYRNWFSCVSSKLCVMNICELLFSCHLSEHFVLRWRTPTGADRPVSIATNIEYRTLLVYVNMFSDRCRRGLRSLLEVQLRFGANKSRPLNIVLIYI